MKTSTAKSAKSHKPSGKSLFAVGTVVVLAVGIALLAVFVFPTQQYFEQRDRITETEQVLQQLREETGQLFKQVEAAQDPIAVERSARKKLSLVRAGDTLYQLNVSPVDAVRLPPDWPLVGVKHLLGVD